MPGNSARRSAERRSTTRLPQPSEFNLTEVREKWLPVQEAPVAVVRLAQDMNRTVLLASLGALQGRRQKITHALPEARAADIPPGATPTVAGGMRVWQTEAAAGWREMMHPQWVGQVWADQRCRLLDTDPNAAQSNVSAGVCGEILLFDRCGDPAAGSDRDAILVRPGADRS